MTRETTEERTRKRWKQAMDLFDQSFLLAPTEREQLLNSAIEQDPELRSMLDQLFLASRDAESGGFLESPAWSYQPIESNPQAMIGREIGAYRLTQYLAKGGMGIVYLGERADQFFRRQVAVKFINADTGPKHYARFRREVQILADLKHPNLVMLYDAGRLGDGRPYIVMEYVEGESLRDWSQRRGPVSPAMVVEIIKQACAGLHAAHEAGVIHRDIKPANIALSENGDKLTVKVLDFGVAARKQHDNSGVSSTQGAIGTLLYMSPEQLQSTKGRDLTPASDIYALGLTAYELLTGRPANDGLSQGEIITKHLYEIPPSPSLKRPDLNIPLSFDRVIMKALVKDPRQRFQSAVEFAVAMETALKQTAAPAETPAEITTENLEESSRRETELFPSESPHNPPYLAPETSRLPDKPPAVRKKAIVTIAATTFVALAVAGTYLGWQQWQSALPVHSFSTAEPSPSALARTPAPAQPVALEFALNIDSGQRSYSGCRFALFRPEVQTIPEQINAQNALVIFEGISRKYPEKAVKPAVAIKQPVEPGEYLVRFSCPGFKPIEEKRLVEKSEGDPNLATIKIALTPE